MSASLDDDDALSVKTSDGLLSDAGRLNRNGAPLERNASALSSNPQRGIAA